MTHIALAAWAINQREFELRVKTRRKFSRLADRIMDSPLFRDIIRDDSFDL
jgi:hypothetical protein